jgi:hypothetical protein
LRREKKMNEKVKEIQERWHRLPVPTYNQSARDIGYLLSFIKELQDHANKLGEIITDQTNKRLKLEFRIKELEEGIEKHKNTNEWDSVYGNRDEELYKLIEENQ